MHRFRLRTFLIVITAFCLLLGWRVAAVESVERPIRELERLGWEVGSTIDLSNSAYAVGYSMVEESTDGRSYWQKLLLGYRDIDLPLYADYWSLNGIEGTSTLQLTSTPVEWCVRSVSLINSLRSLDRAAIFSPLLTADSAAPLSELTHVRSLNLSHSPIGDEGILPLAALSQLDDLYLWEAKATKEGVEKLQQLLPECDIMSEYD